MATTATSIDQYLETIPEERREALTKLRRLLQERLPKGFSESFASGMIHFAVPHALYPAGYHCNPKQPLPFISIASQKNFVALYHMGLYSDPELLRWFEEEYPKHSKTKLDMGKSCIRFKKPEAIPFDLLGELAGKMTPQQWIARYEAVIKR